MTLESERQLERFRVPVAGFPRPVGHSRVTADRRVLQQAAIYYGGLLLADAVGAATVAVYDGLDATGDLIDFLDTDAASDADRTWYDRGRRLLYGLYVDLGSNVDQCIVFWDPPPAERV